MHKPAHKHTHYATRSQALLVCVWNERRVVHKTTCLKKALPCLRDKHHSVTRFSGYCFLTVYFCFSIFLSQCPVRYFAKEVWTKILIRFEMLSFRKTLFYSLPFSFTRMSRFLSLSAGLSASQVVHLISSKLAHIHQETVKESLWKQRQSTSYRGETWQQVWEIESSLLLPPSVAL